MFTVHIAFYESTFVDENKEEYVFSSELIYVNKVDCLNDTIGVWYNKDALIPIHKKHIPFIEICNMIGSRHFDLYINGNFYKRGLYLKRNGLYVYDVTHFTK